MTLGLLLIAIGVAWLLDKWSLVMPIAFIVAGARLLILAKLGRSGWRWNMRKGNGARVVWSSETQDKN